MKLIFLFVTLLGCANTPQTEQEIYESAARKEAMHDQIRALRNACANTPGMVEVYTGRASGSDRTRMRKDINYVPKNAHRTDFQCGRTQDVMRQLGRF
jgi:hypothetical protein